MTTRINITLKVELLAGCDIDEAAMELCDLATRTGVRIEADFNGVTLWAQPGDSPRALVDSFHEELPRKGYRIARARRARGIDG